MRSSSAFTKSDMMASIELGGVRSPGIVVLASGQGWRSVVGSFNTSTGGRTRGGTGK